jgi:hypothetical protein
MSSLSCSDPKLLPKMLLVSQTSEISEKDALEQCETIRDNGSYVWISQSLFLCRIIAAISLRQLLLQRLDVGGCDGSSSVDDNWICDM